MSASHFRLTLEAGPRSILRLLQVIEYDFHRRHVSIAEATVSRDLAAALRRVHPGKSPEMALNWILGREPLGWTLLPLSGNTFVIETGPDGASLPLLYTLLEIAAPDALEHVVRFRRKGDDPETE
jgi:hypothetical protein